MALDWSRGSSRRGGGGALDWSRSSSRRSGGSDRPSDLDRSLWHGRQVHARQSLYLKHMSGMIADPLELDLDQRRLQSAVREVGEGSFGVDAIAVWMVDEETGRLNHPPGGWWCNLGREGNEALARLEDHGREDYVPPTPVCPGTDIAGILWAESDGGGATPIRRSSTLRRAFDSGVSLKSLDQPEELNYQPMRWRDLRSIEQDPDSAKGPRLKLMVEAGFCHAAGITFRYQHHRGMVIFLTAVEDRNDDGLESVANGAYLYQAAQYIGATLSLAEIRRASLAERYSLKEKCYRVRDLAATQDSARALEEGTGAAAEQSGKGSPFEKNDETSRHCHIPTRAMVYMRKLKGGSMQVPPPLSWRQSAWTIFGSFVGLLVLSSLNEYYRQLSDDEYFLLIGPFGAMCTLMYGLSAAPASQPRNAVGGQAIAGAVSLAFTYIPDDLLPVWIRTAVGPAFAIGAMVKFGVVHPPAGAHSVLYASGKYNFAFYALVVLSTAISVVPATIVNNMSTKRQYPTYWGLSYVVQALSWIRQRLCFFDYGKQEIFRSGDRKNLDATNSVDITASDRQPDIGKRSGTKVQPNRLVIHEDDGEDGSDGSVQEVIRI